MQRQSIIDVLHGGTHEPSSFNDDSSPHTHLTAGLKVSIDAQVSPGNSLDWYYQLVTMFPNIPAEVELKSKSVLPKFNSLTREQREEIWRRGLSRVRIHIVDPRPYKASIDGTLRSAFKRDDAP